MRDHLLKNEAGRIEDEILVFLHHVEEIAGKAAAEGAEAHAEFYSDIASILDDAAGAMKSAYTLILNGDGIAIEPLDDEVAA